MVCGRELLPHLRLSLGCVGEDCVEEEGLHGGSNRRNAEQSLKGWHPQRKEKEARFLGMKEEQGSGTRGLGSGA